MMYFDIRGNLQPAQIIECDLASFEEILRNTNSRANAIARLLNLIEMDTTIIDRYRLDGGNDNLQQYVDLRQRNINTLIELLNANGVIHANISVNSAA